MLFNSQIFLLIFLPLSLWLFYSLKTIKSKTVLLLIVSLIFYGWWDVRFLPLLLVSIVFNWFIAKVYSKNENVKIIPVAIFVNLLILGFFKYFNFFSETISEILGREEAYTFSIGLPLGISFFTFHQISYLVDLKRKTAPQYSLLDYSFYICFFPHLIAGPIIRHYELIPQIKKILTVEYREIALGLTLLIIGLIKKLFIADTISPTVNALFEAAKLGTISCPEAWLACLGFGVQIYFDFSGYSDMAVGLGKMFGFHFPVNFNAPYTASSIRDFWQRWHMTLSQFLRDYLYIPLGGNRVGKFRQYLNLFITMVLAGFWHGAGWLFVIWGGCHGIALVINHFWHAQQWRMPKILGWFLTMSFVFVTWIIFRSETWAQAKQILESLINFQGNPVNVGTQHFKYRDFALLLPGVFVISWEMTRIGVLEKIKANMPNAILLGILMTACLLKTGAESAIEFIYFQF